MAKEIAVITATTVERKRMISYGFMFDSGAPDEVFQKLENTYGLLCLRDKFENEVDPWKLVEGKPGAVGPDGIRKWEVNVGTNGEEDCAGNAEEAPPQEAGLKHLLSEIPDCVLLMQRDIFDRFAQACNELGIIVNAFHYEGTLASS